MGWNCTALTVDDVAIDGKVVTMTGSSGDTFVTTVIGMGIRARKLGKRAFV